MTRVVVMTLCALGIITGIVGLLEYKAMPWFWVIIISSIVMALGHFLLDGPDTNNS